MSTDRIRAVLKLLIETIVGLELEGQQEVDDAIALASAALATKPDEEVVAATQRLEALAAFMEPGSQDRWVVENAASLLSQLSAAARAVAPVAVSERPWERPGWCDESGRCWVGWPGDFGLRCWQLLNPRRIFADYVLLLPAYALPLPAPQGGEVQA